MIPLALIATFALLIMLITAVHNVLAFPRLVAPQSTPTNAKEIIKREKITREKAQPGKNVALSILIPARNEAAVIGETVRSLCEQSHRSLEILVLDDHSEDGTATVVKHSAAGDTRVRVLTGTPLPTDWSGKNWACHQLVQAAKHDFLLFTDADVSWQPDAIAELLALQVKTNADLLTIWPTQSTVTWGERLIVPLMNFAVWAYLPIWLVHHTPFPAASAANGQCLLFRRNAYQQCGGHAAVRNRVLDDVLLAQRIKATGGRLRMADGAGLLHCRMYQSWQDAHLGYAKNILAGHGGIAFLLLLSTLLHLLLFVAPWLWLLGGLFISLPYWPQWPLSLITMGLFIRWLVTRATGQREWDTLTMPIGVLLMTAIAAQSLWWHYRGGPRWKGRLLPNA